MTGIENRKILGFCSLHFLEKSAICVVNKDEHIKADHLKEILKQCEKNNR